MKVKSLSHVQLFETPWFLHPWNFPGKNTGVCCHLHLQGMFLSQGSNPDLPHCEQTLLLSEPPAKLPEPQGKPTATGMGSLPLLQGISPGIEPGSPALQADSLPIEL